MLSIDGGMLLFEVLVEFLRPVFRNLGNLCQALLSKASALRVNIAPLDEGARFACTAAEVRLVDEAAPLMHIIVQITPRTGKHLPKVAGRKLHEFCPHLAAHPKHLSQDEDQPLSRIQAE